MFPVSCRFRAIRGPVERASGKPQAPGEVALQAGPGADEGGALLPGGGVGEGEAGVAEGVGLPDEEGEAEGSTGTGRGSGFSSPGHSRALSGQEPAVGSLRPVRSAW
ncbi:hypothetical protein [Streptomyces sp. NBC_01264]|uniref:hypothetical protein n=1 Tax=Streptomyces sp. NBC_01264 TaxID=2903804 RepID=UPI002258BFE7|nr:hypothetical protein [Streptomyces sp. NBC_01264]MCX4782054.1 hypothetical protein [Streptomyces sp. NBC_01264]